VFANQRLGPPAREHVPTVEDLEGTSAGRVVATRVVVCLENRCGHWVGVGAEGHDDAAGLGVGGVRCSRPDGVVEEGEHDVR